MTFLRFIFLNTYSFDEHPSVAIGDQNPSKLRGKVCQNHNLVWKSNGWDNILESRRWNEMEAPNGRSLILKRWEQKHLCTIPKQGPPQVIPSHQHPLTLALRRGFRLRRWGAGRSTRACRSTLRHGLQGLGMFGYCGRMWQIKLQNSDHQFLAKIAYDSEWGQ